MVNALQVTDLRKDYGAFQALKGVSFTIAPGEIFALIGPNGAGKSTTLRIIATLLVPSSGTATVAGFNVHTEAEKVREIISYLPEEAGAYKNLKGREYLRFMAGLYTDSSADQKRYLTRAEEISGLKDRLNDKVGAYSKGMTRRLLLARAVMTQPKLTILDEPTSGLDIVNSQDIRKTVRALVKEGTSVLLSSHNMLEIEYLADRVGIMHQGKLHDTGTSADLKAKYRAANLEEVFLNATGA